MPPLRRLLRPKRLLAVALVLVGLWLVASLVVGLRLTARPHPLFPEPAPAGWEALRLRSADGEGIGAWLAGRDRACPVAVLMLHANGASRSSAVTRTGPFLAAHCAVMLISMRAHGDSTGTRNDFGYSARHDVVAAVNRLKERFPRSSIVVQGASLGAAAAIFAAPELGNRVQGYILESPYQDLRTALRHRTQIYLPSGLDRLASLSLELVSPLVLPDLDRISPLDNIDKIPADVPILLMAGAKDPRARLQEAQGLQEKVASHARLVVFPEARHQSLQGNDPTLYQASVDDFLTKAKAVIWAGARPESPP